jgi:hypothetical protein
MRPLAGRRNENVMEDEKDEEGASEDEEFLFQPRLRDLDKPEELHKYWIELKDRETIETVRCHEMVVDGLVVRFLLRLKAGGAFLALMVPLDHVDAIEEQLYDEDDWCCDGEYRGP